QLYERCQEEYRRALAMDPGPLKGPTLLRLAWRAKRARDWAAAIAFWEQAMEAGEIEAHRELAMHHEHRTRDYKAALIAAESGLRALPLGDEGRLRRVRWNFERRIARIRRKLGLRR